ncbi:integrase family protein [Bradyrhizobium sp. BWC-3-1]|uniref:tyrosine-type recombinase/integrase n=1 Tax=Bradyrhizobium sp. BWC-3-1 TaxID=3080012 RepID=UPI00293EA3A5|nr:integrase family protein [Bradyrhizobium sp. BWC-3-1]WOH55286.1 integrase family protein [Bradyrhizobium sp. BWC-3-1]
MSGQTITKTLVDSLEKRTGEYTIWDAKLPGFGVRVRPTGAKSFIIVYRAGTGRTAPVRRLTLAAVGKIAPEVARTEAKILLGTVANGADPAAEKRANRPKRERLTFDELAQLYLDQYAKVRKSSWKNDEGYLKKARTKWKRRIAAEITDDDVAELLEEIGGTAPVGANRTQSVLHTLFSWAKEPGRKHVPANPVADMRRRYQESPRERVLSDDEIKALWWGLDDPALPAGRPIALALRFILATMVRPGQSAGLLVPELVGFTSDDPQYHIPKNRVKKRREVIVPMNGLAISVVREAIVSEGQGAVFSSWTATPNSDGSQSADGSPVDRPPRQLSPITRDALSAALNGRPAKGKRPARKGIREHLGMAHFTPHDLRRTAATIARRGGAKREDVKALLDHLEGDVTATYDKYDMLPEKRTVVAILEAELRKIVGTRPVSRAPLLVVSENVVSIVEGERRIVGSVNR